MSSISSSGVVIVREERSRTTLKAVVTLHDLLRAQAAPSD